MTVSYDLQTPHAPLFPLSRRPYRSVYAETIAFVVRRDARACLETTALYSRQLLQVHFTLVRFPKFLSWEYIELPSSRTARESRRPVNRKIQGLYYRELGCFHLQKSLISRVARPQSLNGAGLLCNTRRRYAPNIFISHFSTCLSTTFS